MPDLKSATSFRGRSTNWRKAKKKHHERPGRTLPKWSCRPLEPEVVEYSGSGLWRPDGGPSTGLLRTTHFPIDRCPFHRVLVTIFSKRQTVPFQSDWTLEGFGFGPSQLSSFDGVPTTSKFAHSTTATTMTMIRTICLADPEEKTFTERQSEIV